MGVWSWQRKELERRDWSVVSTIGVLNSMKSHQEGFRTSKPSQHNLQSLALDNLKSSSTLLSIVTDSSATDLLCQWIVTEYFTLFITCVSIRG